MKLLTYRLIPFLIIGMLGLAACNNEDEDDDNGNGPITLTADAGPDIGDALVGETVQLNGSNSSASEGSFEYLWSFLSKPQGSQANIENETGVIAEFTPDVEGTYSVQLTITNGNQSDSDNVDVYAEASSANAIILECDDITSPTTWTDHATGTDYVVQANCYFGIEGATLTIEPGTTIEFESDAGIYIGEGGALNAVGTPAAMITFTGTQKTRGFWKGINFWKTNNVENVLDYVIVEYGGSDYETEYSNVALGTGSKSRLAVNNSILREASSYGFYLADEESEISSFANNEISANGEGAVYLNQHAAGMLDASSTYAGNDMDAIFVETDINDPTTADMTWQNLDVPFRITGSGLSVGSGMTVEPGTTIEFEQDTRITIRDDGYLNATGQAGNTITFTGVNKTAGYWQGILFRNSLSAENKLHYCIVEYGGGNDTDDANVKIGRNNKAVVSINNSTLRNATKYGLLLLQPESEITSFQNNIITGNGAEPVYIEQHAVGMLEASSSYTGNANDYIRVEGDVNDQFENDQVWEKLDVDYFLESSVGVRANLTINPGVTLVMGANTVIYYKDEGTLTAVGTQAEPITFTGMEKVKGYWNHIENRESNSTENRLEYVIVEYGGSEDALYLSDYGNSRVYIENSTFRHSSGNGIQIEGNNSNYNSNIETGNTFEDIDGEDVILP